MSSSLADYLSFAGILAMKPNPQIPCLADVGFTWDDAVALINARGLFYCKVYRARVTFLSLEAYALLRQLHRPTPLTPLAREVLSLLQEAGPLEIRAIRTLLPLSGAAAEGAINLLLRELLVTAVQGGRKVYGDWSTLVYGAVEGWREGALLPECAGDPRAQLEAILTRTMPRAEFELLRIASARQV